MKKSLYLLAANKLIDVYAGNCKRKGSTEWNTYTEFLDGKLSQVLAIAGTNDWRDWGWNLCLLSKDGVKYGSWVSTQRILKDFKRLPGIPLYIAVHSKSGPTGIYLQEKLNATHCVAFCPARGFTKKQKNKNVTMFIDKDDYVPKMGWSRFRHRISRVVWLPKDKKWWNLVGKIKDHSMVHIREFITKM